jgi:hypothetical protein
MGQFGTRDRDARLLTDPGLNGAIRQVIILDPGAGLDLGPAVTARLRRHHIRPDPHPLMLESGFEDRPVGLFGHHAPGIGQRLNQIIGRDQCPIRLQRLGYRADGYGHDQRRRPPARKPPPVRGDKHTARAVSDIAGRPVGGIWRVRGT